MAASNSTGNRQLYYMLRAAQASLAAQRPEDAMLLADEVLRLQRDPMLRGAALWIRARALLAEGKNKEASSNLEDLLTVPGIEPMVREEALGILAAQYGQEGHAFTALNFLIERDSLLRNPEDLTDNHRRIRAILNAQPTWKLQNWETRTANPQVQEWIALFLIERNTPDPAQRQRAIADWLAAHPGHPAIHAFGLPGAPAATEREAGDICAILPGTGPYKPLSAAIAAGMEVAASLQGGPAVKVYDSTGNSQFTATLYKRAVGAGCAAIVGPWLRQDISAVAAVRRRTDPPLLALGSVAGLRQPRLYQFNMDASGPGGQVATDAYRAGLRAAYVLYPQDSSGAAMQAAFLGRWRALGGQVLGVRAYTPGQYPGPAVRALLGKGTGTGGTFLFLAATAAQGEAIVPMVHQMRPALPILAGAAMANGVGSPRATALNGVYFVDMPWVVNPSAAWPEAAADLQREMVDPGPGQWRMAAFGVDAYRLILRILHGDDSGILDGVTGRLRFQSDGQVMRSLSWARYENGAVVPVPGLSEYASHAVTTPATGN